MGAEAGGEGEGEGAGAGVAASRWRGRGGEGTGCECVRWDPRGSARRSLPPPPPSRTPANIGGGDDEGPSAGSFSLSPSPFLLQPLWPPGRTHARSGSGGRLCPWRQTLGFYFISLVGGCVYVCVCVCVCVCVSEHAIVPSYSPQGGGLPGSPADRWSVSPPPHGRRPSKSDANWASGWKVPLSPGSPGAGR